jgi:hypothetical protein
MRKVIAAFKISADGKYAGPGGYPDWVNGWPDEYGSWLTTEIDACVLGGQLYPMYEQYWTQVQDAPDEIHPLSGHVRRRRMSNGPGSRRRPRITWCRARCSR